MDRVFLLSRGLPAWVLGYKSHSLYVTAAAVSRARVQAGCASVAGCLWDVTDRDLDRFTCALVSTWLLPVPVVGAVAGTSKAGPGGQGGNLLPSSAPAPPVAPARKSSSRPRAAADAAAFSEGGAGTALVSSSKCAELELPLPLCVAVARGVCKLGFLVGASPVCYGLPVVAAP
jgi:separase